MVGFVVSLYIDQAEACNMLRTADLGARILTEGMISIGDRIQVVL